MQHPQPALTSVSLPRQPVANVDFPQFSDNPPPNTSLNKHSVQEQSHNPTDKLLTGLEVLPQEWALTPVNGNKQPYRENWQNEQPITREKLIAMIKSGLPQGYGLRTGKWSVGILAIDADGQAAHEKLNQLGGLPKTVAFTSGKSGRCQYLVRVPKEYWSVVKTQKINTGVKGENGKDQLLEFRWTGCQSVLPPSVHPETGQYNWVNSPEDCEIVQCPTWVIELFQTKAQATETFSHLYSTGDVPLYECLSKDDRALIDHGTGEGERDDKGAKLARNLIGTALRLNHLGHRFEGEPRALLDIYCSRCTPPLDEKDADRIWKSALKSNPTATLSDDYLNNCIKAWHRQQTKEKSPQAERTIASNSNVIPHPTARLTSDELVKEINVLIDSECSQSEVKVKLGELSARSNNRKVIDIYNARLKEREQAFDREMATKQLPTLLEAQKARLNPNQLLWGDGGKLASLMDSVALAMPISPELLLTTLFPVAGSRIGTSSRLVVNPATGYTVTSIFWTCVVASSGSLKTPSQQVIIKPLNKLEAIEYEKWQQAKDDYKQQLKRCAKGDELPDEPAPRKRFIIQGCTAEARMKIHGENKRGILYHRDEWAGFITGRNKYRAGKGDDSQLDLSEFNGEALFKDVVDSDKCIYLERSAISRTGNTQPEVLKQFQSQQNFADFAGEFARWLFCLRESPVAYIDLFKDNDETGQQLEQEFISLYKALGRLPERDYFLSDKAKEIYQAYQHKLMHWLQAEEHPGLKNTYPKFQTYLGRFALWLHLVNAVLAGESTPHQFINGQIMAVACRVIDFYLAQARLLYALNSDQQSLAGNFLKIKEYIDKHPSGVTVRQIKAGIKAMQKVPSSEIEQDCQSLIRTGVIKQVAKHYIPNLSKNVDFVDSLLTRDQQPQTIDVYELQKNVDFVDQFVHDSKKQDYLDEHLNNFEKTDFIENLVNTGQQNSETGLQHEVERVDHGSTKGQQKVNKVNTNSETTSQQEVKRVDQWSTSDQQTVNKVNAGHGFKKGDRVAFHEGDKNWQRGTIKDCIYESGYFVRATIEYYAFKKNRTVVICREDWLKFCDRRYNKMMASGK
ncbi:DUF3987 domain-containing protein [Komarekiella sp. 'clone 1']|uniref:DUF3987 domain-containing protein n=1 Tax=Komarekiella delphini-convector SJRDD-AB1 TaxID=2593771 RepID=A0AA40T2X2_9NOST|nr:DUF3987 domain-containing protein [Komarekiella delphini-convector]MBD6619705.1 DUF3987 domain-containing protein [Komarekiella delphini-convector SJRDD-AB1]